MNQTPVNSHNRCSPLKYDMLENGITACTGPTPEQDPNSTFQLKKTGSEPSCPARELLSATRSRTSPNRSQHKRKIGAGRVTVTAAVGSGFRTRTRVRGIKQHLQGQRGNPRQGRVKTRQFLALTPTPWRSWWPRHGPPVPHDLSPPARAHARDRGSSTMNTSPGQDSSGKFSRCPLACLSSHTP